MDIAILLAILIVPIMAEIMIIKNYNKCNNKINENNISGMEIAHTILEKNKLSEIYVVEIPDKLTDHYDINRKVVRLAKDVFNNNTITSLVIASQESAHAIQDKKKYKLLRFRDILNPIMKLIVIFAYVVAIIGILMNDLSFVDIGIVLISFVLVFHLVTLPVEFNANKIAFEQLKKNKLIDKKEEEVVSRLLRTISFKYIASILTSIKDLVRYLTSLINDRR